MVLGVRVSDIGMFWYKVGVFGFPLMRTACHRYSNQGNTSFGETHSQHRVCCKVCVGLWYVSKKLTDGGGSFDETHHIVNELIDRSEHRKVVLSDKNAVKRIN